MHFLAITATLLLATLTSAAPSPSPSSSGSSTITLDAIHNAKHRLNLSRTYARLRQKYNLTSIPLSAAPPRPKRRRSQHDSCWTGSTTAIPSHATPHDNDGSEFLCAVAIGTPPQHFRLNLDTGSSDLWVYGLRDDDDTELDAPRLRKRHRLYRPNQSRTAARLPGEAWLAGYVDGGFVGGDEVYTDRVVVGGGGDVDEKKGNGSENQNQNQNQSQLVVETQGVQMAKLVSDSIFNDSTMDGILGLGFAGKNFATPVKQKTWFSNIQHELREPLFTVDFRHNQAGQYTFGYIDQNRLTGPVAWTPVDASTALWTWTSSGYGVGDKPFRRRALTGTLDTGTPINMLPGDVVDEYYAAVAGASYSAEDQGYVFDCEAALPDFWFGVGEDRRVRIPGAYFNASVSVAASNSSSSSSSKKKCVGGLQKSFDGGGSHGNDGIVIFGAVALKAGLAVFDVGGMRIGWANKTLEG